MNPPVSPRSIITPTIENANRLATLSNTLLKVRTLKILRDPRSRGLLAQRGKSRLESKTVQGHTR